jgi:hypothetical protein
MSISFPALLTSLTCRDHCKQEILQSPAGNLSFALKQIIGCQNRPVFALLYLSALKEALRKIAANIRGSRGTATLAKKLQAWRLASGSSIGPQPVPAHYHHWKLHHIKKAA